jgi:hypothetical protein
MSAGMECAITNHLDAGVGCHFANLIGRQVFLFLVTNEIGFLGFLSPSVTIR